MTNRLLTISVFAALATANMQAQQPVTLKVDVPFNFHVGVTAMPAGEYFISPNLLAQGTLVMRSTTGKASVIVKTVPESIGQPAVQAGTPDDDIRQLRQQPAARGHRATDGRQRGRGAAGVQEQAGRSRLQGGVIENHAGGLRFPVHLRAPRPRRRPIRLTATSRCPIGSISRPARRTPSTRRRSFRFPAWHQGRSRW